LWEPAVTAWELLFSAYWKSAFAGSLKAIICSSRTVLVAALPLASRSWTSTVC
jgi:hypothetical protein